MAGEESVAIEPTLFRAEVAGASKPDAAGIFRKPRFRAGRRNAAPILERDLLGTAREMLAALPLVAAGMARLELIPLAPYLGFARPFTE